MRHNILLSTLLFLLSAGSFSHFNYRYDSHLMSVNEINNVKVQFFGKDNQLDQSSKRDFILKTVVIDPGHGGHDHGCSGKHSKEKHVALKIAKKVGGYIKNKFPKVNVIYTRDKDVFIPLHHRAKIANENKADLFISIHCNAVSKQKHLVRGTETYVMGLHDADENLAVAKRENEAILLEKDYEKNYDGFDPESPTGHIILAMVQNAFLEQSISFAEKVETNFENIAGRKSRGVKQAGFLVLRETTMPSVLIETGYLTNKNEEQFMVSAKGQDDLAFSIFHAFQTYKREVEMDNSTNALPLPAKSNTARIEKPKATPIIESEEIATSTPKSKKKKKKRKKRLRKRFKVQLASTTNKISTSSAKWKNVKFPVEIKKEKGKFKYLAGNFKTLEAANAARQKLVEAGFEDAFVVAYKGKKRVEK